MDTLQLIAEPHRREILALVWDDEVSAGDIAVHFDVTFGAVSQHLSLLRSADLVTVRKDGNRRLYSANHDVLAPYESMLKAAWKETLAGLAEVIEAETDSK